MVHPVPSLFGYGTLQHPPVLHRLLGRVPEMLAGDVHPGAGS